MKNWYKVMSFSLVLMSAFFVGCTSTPPEKAPAPKDKGPKAVPTDLRCRFKAGQVERVRYTSTKMNKVWVEMPNKEPSQTGMNETNKEIVLRTEVLKVDSDGSALVNVTIEQVRLDTMSDVNKKKRKSEYYSGNKKTTTSTNWSGEPKLAGASYKIKINPDTSVQKIMGLADLMKKLKIKEEDNKVVNILITEQAIKQYHERDFVRFSPAEVTGASKNKTALPKQYEKDVPIPDDMIKAKALKKKYTVGAVESKDAQKMVTIKATGEPLHVLPEGMEEPTNPQDMGKNLIKQMSNIHELKINDVGQFDLTTGTVKSEKENLKCTLIILDKDIAPAKNQKQKDSGGAMFTEITMNSDFEVLK